jgi:hypothetical protein
MHDCFRFVYFLVASIILKPIVKRFRVKADKDFWLFHLRILILVAKFIPKFQVYMSL